MNDTLHDIPGEGRVPAAWSRLESLPAPVIFAGASIVNAGVAWLALPGNVESYGRQSSVLFRAADAAAITLVSVVALVVLNRVLATFGRRLVPSPRDLRRHLVIVPILWLFRGDGVGWALTRQIHFRRATGWYAPTSHYWVENPRIGVLAVLVGLVAVLILPYVRRREPGTSRVLDLGQRLGRLALPALVVVIAGLPVLAAKSQAGPFCDPPTVAFLVLLFAACATLFSFELRPAAD